MSVKSIGIAVAVVALSAIALPAHAELKIAVVRGADVVQGPTRDAEAAMNAEFSKRRTDLEAAEQKFEEDVKKYQRDADTMTADQRTRSEKDLNSRKFDLAHDEQQLNQDMEAKRRQLGADMQSKIRNALTAVAKDKGLDLIIADPAYASSNVADVTPDVLKKLAPAAAAK